MSRRGTVICRLLNSHKWARLQTRSEEAYECLRCGKRFFGKVGGDPNYTAFTGGDGSS